MKSILILDTSENCNFKQIFRNIRVVFTARRYDGVVYAVALCLSVRMSQTGVLTRRRVMRFLCDS